MLINILLVLLFLNPFSSAYPADRDFFHVAKAVEASPPKRINPENVGVEISAEKYVALDVASGKILIQKNVDSVQPIASITKLMTALVVLDEVTNWDKVVEMTASDETEGAFAHIYRGEKVTFADLWHAALISSDNNSIMAMVRALGFSQDEFVKKMNEKARALQMYNTKFADPTGLATENYSTALDVSRLLYAALNQKKIQETVTKKKYSFEIINSAKKRTVTSTDILLDSFLNQPKYGYTLFGGKTGYIPEAGYCLTVQITSNNHPVLITVLNSSDIEARFQDVKVIADWVFNNYEWEN